MESALVSWEDSWQQTVLPRECPTHGYLEYWIVSFCLVGGQRTQSLECAVTIPLPGACSKSQLSHWWSSGYGCQYASSSVFLDYGPAIGRSVEVLVWVNYVEASCLSRSLPHVVSLPTKDSAGNLPSFSALFRYITGVYDYPLSHVRLATEGSLHRRRRGEQLLPAACDEQRSWATEENITRSWRLSALRWPWWFLFSWMDRLPNKSHSCTLSLSFSLSLSPPSLPLSLSLSLPPLSPSLSLFPSLSLSLSPSLSPPLSPLSLPLSPSLSLSLPLSLSLSPPLSPSLSLSPSPSLSLKPLSSHTDGILRCIIRTKHIYF